MRKHRTDKNGQESEDSEDYVVRVSALISKNLFMASGSPETANFLCELIANRQEERAKHILDFMLDVHPRHVAMNPKFGKVLSKLIEAGDATYSISLMNRLIFGKVNNGPSVTPHAHEVASNKSLDSIVEGFSTVGLEDRAGLLLHQLAVLAPDELARNTRLDACLETLRRHKQDTTAKMVDDLTLPIRETLSPKRKTQRFRSR